MHRCFVVSILLVAGCSDPKPIAEDTVARAYCVRASDDVKQLRAELGALPKPDAMTPSIIARLDAIEKRVAAVEQAKGAKQLHLIVRETGDDLGISVDGALAAWNEEHQAVIDYRELQSAFLFEGDNCTGASYFQNRSDIASLFNRYFFGGGERLFRPRSTLKIMFNKRSQLNPDGTCMPEVSVNDGIPAVEAAFKLPAASPAALSIEPR